MATLAITTPVEVRDNGVRSFIPPTFCFELVTANCEIGDTVSAVSLQGRAPLPNVEDFDAAKYLSDSALMALGEVSEYGAGPQARELGRRFTVTEVVPRATASPS